MSEQVKYITNQQGERVGVLLDWHTYSRLANPLALDEECLVGLSVDELKALASCKLAVADQTHLDDLVVRNAESSLCADEVAELDDLLAKADQLTILKTRARYTLSVLVQGNNDSVSVYIRVELQRQIHDRFGECCAYCRTAACDYDSSLVLAGPFCDRTVF